MLSWESTRIYGNSGENFFRLSYSSRVHYCARVGRLRSQNNKTYGNEIAGLSFIHPRSAFREREGITSETKWIMNKLESKLESEISCLCSGASGPTTSLDEGCSPFHIMQHRNWGRKTEKSLSFSSTQSTRYNGNEKDGESFPYHELVIKIVFHLTRQWLRNMERWKIKWR